eukprot:Trichotokara_eunicae@DN966_c0_g1_i2.p1
MRVQTGDENPWSLAFKTSTPHRAEFRFLKMMEKHKWRTHNPEEAVLFVVPFFPGLAQMACKKMETAREEAIRYRAEVTDMLEESRWFQNSKGADHLMASTDFGHHNYAAPECTERREVLNNTILGFKMQPHILRPRHGSWWSC